MKKILIGSVFCILTILTAEVEEKIDDEFIKINDNIQNKELRNELNNLREDFRTEKEIIRKTYHAKIKAFKDAHRDELRALKHDFGGRRDFLMKKYVGKIRTKPKMQTTYPPKKGQGLIKTPKKKKKIRKP